MIKIGQIYTPERHPLRASYGVYFVSSTEKNDRDISRAL